MPLEVDCLCGQRFPVSEALAGLSVRCRECGSSVAVPRSGGSAPASSSPPPSHPPASKPQAATQPAPPSAPVPPSAAELKGASSSYDSSPPEQEEGWFNGGVLGGLGLILIAAVWFLVGLALGRVFFYPIILFVIGLGTLLKSVFKGE